MLRRIRGGSLRVIKPGEYRYQSLSKEVSTLLKGSAPHPNKLSLDDDLGTPVKLHIPMTYNELLREFDRLYKIKYARSMLSEVASRSDQSEESVKVSIPTKPVRSLETQPKLGSVMTKDTPTPSSLKRTSTPTSFKDPEILSYAQQNMPDLYHRFLSGEIDQETFRRHVSLRMMAERLAKKDGKG